MSSLLGIVIMAWAAFLYLGAWTLREKARKQNRGADEDQTATPEVINCQRNVGTSMEALFWELRHELQKYLCENQKTTLYRGH